MITIFVLLTILAQLGMSRPSDNLGYAYAPQYNSEVKSLSNSYGETTLNGNSFGSSNTNFQTQTNQCNPPQHSPHNNQLSQYFSTSSRSQSQQSQLDNPLVTKNFYIYTAPKSYDDQEIVRYINIGHPQKNYRVIFINTESSLSSKAKIIAKVAPTEEKTAIYVLSKQSSDLDINTEIVTPAPIEHSKPEVFFVKYKTSEEAQRAQNTIQGKIISFRNIKNFVNFIFFYTKKPNTIHLVEEVI